MPEPERVAVCGALDTRVHVLEVRLEHFQALVRQLGVEVDGDLLQARVGTPVFLCVQARS